MEADWDLHAVVRGFASIGNTHSTSHAAQKVDMRVEEEQQKRDGFCSKSLAEELHELFTPYLLNPPQTGRSVQPTISSYLAALEASKFKQHKQWNTNNKALIPISAANSVPITTTSTSVAAVGPPPPHSQSTHKPKRRKFQLKNISHVRAEALSADAWAWRKYGQKPIKGSPYPRGYYKCSSSKTCFARKQVERNRSDPTMFIVTCTGEHNHPAPTRKNSLAGTTRNRHPILPAPLDETMPATSKPSSSSSMENMSPEGSVDDEVLQHINEMEGDMNGNNLVSEMLEFFDMDVNDDFFDGLDEIEVTPVNGSSFSDPILPSFTD